MKWGLVYIYCPICGVKINFLLKTNYRHREWGTVCSVKCHEAGELKYARMVMGKDEVDDQNRSD